MTERKEPEEEWPRVDLAYEFVLPSYGWAIKRLDAIDGRIQALQALIVSVTLAVPVFARVVLADGSVDFGSRWFVLALVAFGLSVAIGLVARTAGTIKLLNPDKLYERYLDKSRWEFKRGVLYFAGIHSVENHRLVLRKGWAMTAMAALFLGEAIFLVLWVAGA